MANAGHLINHVVLDLDGSTSMIPRRAELIEMVEGLVAHLATKSQEMNQETRVSIYRFSDHDKIECLIWDRDVLRLPSIASVYDCSGITALIDSALLCLRDMNRIDEFYGNHAHLFYGFTDGIENDSLNGPTVLQQAIGSQPDNRTVAVFVPDYVAAAKVKRCGFPAGNIMEWDTISSGGLADAGFKIREATDNFMEARAASPTFRSTTELFSGSLNTVDLGTVKSELVTMTPGSYELFDVPVGTRPTASKWVPTMTHRPFDLGSAYYELVKANTVQPQQRIALLSPDGQVYTGAEARQLLGLPNASVKVYPDRHADYRIFVQSTAPNRKFEPGTKVLVLR